jgi:hypothetical protein
MAMGQLTHFIPIQTGGMMHHITVYGLALESHATIELAMRYLPRLKERGVTEAFLQQTAEKVKIMETKKTTTGEVRSGTKQLTQNERAAKRQLIADVRAVQDGAKRAFRMRSPQRKEFHVGEKITSSFALLLGCATDVVSAYATYKDALNAKMIVDKDVDAITASREALISLVTTRTMAAQKDSPEATTDCVDAKIEVLGALDQIFGASSAEFRNEPGIVRQFAGVRKLRFSSEPKKPQPAPEPPVTPPNPEN